MEKKAKSAAVKQSARKTVIHQKLQITASVRQDWKTNEHTAFGYGWMPLFVFGAKRLDFWLCEVRKVKRVK